jgi:hypothetical protein
MTNILDENDCDADQTISIDDDVVKYEDIDQP